MANNTNWLNISSQSGSSGQTILTLSANKNLSTNHKTAEITAYNPVYNISAKTYVTLEAYSPILSISPDLFGVPDSGGTYELTITANCAWVIAFPDLVTSYSTSAGTGNAVVTFTVPGTTADTTLAGNIVVTDESGQVSRTARVEQYGSGVHIGIFPVELYFDSTGGSKTFSVTADAAYNVSVGSGTDWAFVEPHSGYTGQTTFTVTVNSENTGTTDKQGVINIDAPGQDLAVILYQRKPETRVVATYYVTSTTDPTRILWNTSSFSKAEYPDGTEITRVTGYTFPSTGSVNVYYTLTGDTVGENTFSGTPITSVVIPKGVASLGQACFANSSGLTSITLPNTLISIGNDCFAGDLSGSSLSAITLPDSLTSIGWQAFRGCTSLSSITIPSAVTNIGTNCFSGSSVSSITFTSLTPPTLGNTNALTSNTLSEIIVPCPAVNDYITAWPQYAQYISCQDTGTTLYFVTDTSNVKGIGETRTITILNTNINPNRTGLNLPSDFPQQGSYTVVGNTIYITYPRNPSSSATRSWTIGVVAETNDGVSLSGSYSIRQDANTIYSIPFTADTSTVAGSGETRTITIDTSNLVASSITIGVEGATGVTYTYENGVITITFPDNSGPGTGTTRNVTVTISGVTIGGNEAYAEIHYTQEYEYTGETRMFVIYRQSDNKPVKLGYNQFWTKAELEDGTDITDDIYTPGYGYNFGVAGFYGVYFTLQGVPDPDADSGSVVGLGAYSMARCEALVVNIPNNCVIIYDEAFSSGSFGSICLGEGLKYFGRKVFSFSSIGTLTFRGTTEPTLPRGMEDSMENLFLNTNAGGTLKYPCGADYSTYEEILVEPHSSSSYDHHWDSTCFAASGNCDCLAMGDYAQTRIEATFNVTSTTEPTRILGIDGVTLAYPIYKMELEDGTPLQLTDTGYTFSTLGPNTVYYYPLYKNTFYGRLFEGCSNLTSAVLPSGLTDIPFSTFESCTSLTSVTIPETVIKLNTHCFKGCTALSSITLPSSLQFLGTVGNLGDGFCFSGCTALTGITIPSAVTEVGNQVFVGCTGLQSVVFQSINPPEFDNATFGYNSISFPIYVPCNSVQSYRTAMDYRYSENIQCLGIHYTGDTSVISSTGETRVFQFDFSGVEPGSLYTNIDAADVTYSISMDSTITFVFPQYNRERTIIFTITAITNGLEVSEEISFQQKNEYTEPFTFVIESIADDGAAAGFIYFKNRYNSGNTIQYKRNSGSWTSISSTSGTSSSIRVYSGDTVQFRGSSAWNSGDYFAAANCTFSVKGNIMSLINSTNYSGLTSAAYFDGLFKECTGVTDASKLLLPATNLTDGGYGQMFYKCTNLRAAPKLPATTLSESCYSYMFYSCTTLTQAPVLPATTMQTECYKGMFGFCTGLTAAPELPARTLANDCYWDMFVACHSLTLAPELPATTLATFCYQGMFKSCDSLTESPVLPARILVGNCYKEMFYDCYNLSAVTCLATSVSATNCTDQWLSGAGYYVEGTRKFITRSSTNWTTGTSGIPSGWTRVKYTS